MLSSPCCFVYILLLCSFPSRPHRTSNHPSVLCQFPIMPPQKHTNPHIPRSPNFINSATQTFSHPLDGCWWLLGGGSQLYRQQLRYQRVARRSKCWSTSDATRITANATVATAAATTFEIFTRPSATATQCIYFVQQSSPPRFAVC